MVYNKVVMTVFEKAYWVTDGDSISVRMPISKVNKEKRIVSGWATTDVVDKQGDVVTADASAAAFERFRGNVREQHTPLAVGKVVSFKQDKYYDQETQKFYNGIYVDVYVSKGAEDTWHKVNEGILTGFSIGGSIKDAESVYNKEKDAPVRVIKEYDLYELSLVDNPANPASNIVSVQKFDNQTEDIQKNYLENVYWCANNDAIILSEKSDYACPQCDNTMTNIGFVESSDIDKAASVSALLETFTKSQTSDNKSDSNKAIDEEAKSIAQSIEKEGNNVGILNRKTTTIVEETIAKSEDAAVEEAVAEEVAEVAVEEAAEEAVEEAAAAEEAAEEAVEEAAEEAAEETVEKSTTPTDEGNSEDDLAKAVEGIKESVAAIAELATVVKGIADQVAEMQKSLDSVSQEVNVVKGNVTEFGERVAEVEADTAVRKSGDLGGIVQENKTEKSMWGGRFLNSADLYR